MGQKKKMRKSGKRKNQKKDFVSDFSLFLFPFLAIIPAVIAMWVFDYRLDIISAESGRGNGANFSSILLIEMIYYFSLATVLSLVTYSFKVSVFTAKNYIIFSMSTLFFVLIWSLFKGDLDWIFSWQSIPLGYYIIGYVIVLPLYGVIIYVICLIFQEKMDKFVSFPIKSEKYWRFANYLPSYFLSVTISYFLLKIGNSSGSIAPTVSRFFVYYNGLAYLLLILVFGGIVFIASAVGDKVYQKIGLTKIIKNVLILTIVISLISAMME